MNYRSAGEADRIYFLFTKEYGWLQVLAQGIRNYSSKLRPSLSLFSLAEVGFISRKSIWLLTQCQEIWPFLGIRNNDSKLEIVGQWSLFLERFLRGPEKNLLLWESIVQSFYFLNDTDFSGANLKNFRLALKNFSLYFKLLVLKNLGYIDAKEIPAVFNHQEFNSDKCAELFKKAVSASQL